MKKIIPAAVVLFFIIAGCSQLMATDFKAGETIIITERSTGDIYLAAGTITIEAPIEGDLIGAGGEIWVKDSIMADAILAGGKISINQYINDDLRIFGGQLVINSDIRGDCIISGGDVTIGEGVTIFGELRIAGGKVNYRGRNVGNIHIVGGNVIFNGIAEGNLYIQAEQLVMLGQAQGSAKLVAREITLGVNSYFYNEVQYWQEAGELNISPHLKNNARATFDPSLEQSWWQFNGRKFGRGIFFLWIYRFLAASFFMALLIWAFHRFFSNLSQVANRDYIRQIGYGVLYLLGIPAIIAIAFITVIGIPFGIFTIMFYTISIILGHVIVSVIVAYGLNSYYNKGWNRRALWLVSLCVFLALKLIGFIPVIGFVISIILISIAYGSIINVLLNKEKLSV